MIYNFDLQDPMKDRFLQFMREREIDCEIIENDRVVIRIFGRLDADTTARLESFRAGRLKPTRTDGTDQGICAGFRDTNRLEIIAGPCSIESEEQIAEIVAFLTARNIRFIRGGAFKPRTSPSSFQGLGESGLRIISDHARKAGLKVVTEVMDRSQIDVVSEHADILQVGSRSMFNYTLLTALGAVDKPVLLKRGMSATVDEWLKAAEYITRGGNDKVILCERGIRTFEPSTRNMLDVAAIALAKRSSGLPVIADPSHAAGTHELVAPLAMAAAAAGADGLIVEVHPNPAGSISDRQQALDFERFDALLKALSVFPRFSHGTL